MVEAVAVGVSTHRARAYDHDYKDGTATPFIFLLQAGIAVLADRQGPPTVKCSCGNPLLPFKGDAGHIKVDFSHGSNKWPGYAGDELTAVRPAARPLEPPHMVTVHDVLQHDGPSSRAWAPCRSGTVCGCRRPRGPPCSSRARGRTTRRCSGSLGWEPA
ncbi:DUF6777 domain-containing protein [Streptomyces sp. NBC_00631]|uniref:DUF6777 domain-containing protein n=1 Tax=Streptomyces sp. NBC_00631 TaxID=2975793 RepID=UPI0038683013